MRILNFGSLNIDHVYQVKSIVTPGETIASGSLADHCGGKGLNQSVALARAGMETWHAGKVGADGGMLTEMLRSAGVNTDLVTVTDGVSGHTVIQVDEHGQNSIILYGGTNAQITEKDIRGALDRFATLGPCGAGDHAKVLERFGPGDLLLAQNEISNMPVLLREAAARGMRIILNPSPMDALMQSMDLSIVSLFLLNEVEGGQLTGKTDPDEIMEGLAAKYPAADIVLTLGTAGSRFRAADGTTCAAEALRVKAVDTTAAGDTFTGYFIREYYESGDAAAALALATRASAIAVTRPGAAPSIPTRAEVEAFQ